MLLPDKYKDSYLTDTKMKVINRHTPTSKRTHKYSYKQTNTHSDQQTNAKAELQRNNHTDGVTRTFTNKQSQNQRYQLVNTQTATTNKHKINHIDGITNR